MPVTSYQSFVPEPTDTKEVRMTKLHLGIMSLEEQLYSFNADLAETRKKFEELDREHKVLKEEYERLKRETMRQTFHGITVEINSELLNAVDEQRVQAALLKYAVDFHEEWCREPRDFDPPVLVTNLTVRTSQVGLIFEGSIRHHRWALEVRR